MNWTPSVALWLSSLLTAALGAQRAPCTGRCVDDTGQAIAGARVQFGEQPSQTFGAAPDRVTVTTDAAGRFSAALLHGSPYLVWAIGPADDEGTRLVSDTTLLGAAGRELTVVADRRAAAHRVELRGVAAWRAAVPPALRVLVDGHSIGNDRPLAGDDEVLVGPWPGRRAAFALVDDRLQVLCVTATVDELTNAVEFPAPLTQPFAVVDADGDPVRDARIFVVRSPTERQHLCDPLPTPAVVEVRLAATSGRRGCGELIFAATAPGPDGTMLPGKCALVAMHDSQVAIVGVDGGRPDAALLHDGELHFVLAPTQRLGLVLPGDPAPHLRCQRLFASATPFVVTEDPGSMLDLIAAGTTAPRVDVRAWPSAAGDTRFVFGAMRAGIGAPTAVVEHRVTVRDGEGRPAPFAHVLVLENHEGWQGMRDRCVADADGTVRLVSDGLRLRLVATDQREFGVCALEDRGGAVDLHMQAMPFAELQVHDAGGQPVRTVRVRMQLQWDGVDIVRYFVNQSLLSAVRADGDGVLRLPVLGEQLAVVVELPGGVEAEQTLTPGQHLVLNGDAGAGAARADGIR